MSFDGFHKKAMMSELINGATTDEQVTRSTCSPGPGISSSPSLKKRLSKTDSTGDININHKVSLEFASL